MTSPKRRLTRQEIEEVYRTYGFHLLRRCRGILKNEAMAQDAFQDVFINLIRYGGGYLEANAKLPWLFRVTDRSCFAHLAKQKKEPSPLELDVAAPDVDLLRRQAVVSALEDLDPADQNLAVMAFIEERSQGEIGKALGWSRQTINKRLKKLRGRAEAILAEVAE